MRGGTRHPLTPYSDSTLASGSAQGSKEWIGANEVCYVLDTLCSISSKIMFVDSGAELESKGRELARHFSTVSVSKAESRGAVLGIARG